MTPEMIKSTVHDMEIFLKDTHLQIKHKLDNGFHVSVEKVVKDLEDVDVLLGEPIQAEISAHTGIELAYDSLATLSLVNAELIYRVLMLQETVGRALKLAQEAAARMEELQIQLSVLQRQCTYRDRPLCDTLRIRSFEENGIIDALKTLQEDQAIFRMRYLGEIEFGATVKNLSSEVGMSRSVFSNFPQQVKLDTAYERNYTLEQLEGIRHRTTANAQMLTVTINALLERLKNVWDNVEPHYVKLQDWSNIYWTSGWVAAMVVVWILLFLLMSYCCFLCNANIKAGVILFVAVIIICLSSICITIYGVVSLAIGGNAEIFLCQPMYDSGHEMSTSTITTSISTDIKWKMMNGINSVNHNNKDNHGYYVLGKLFDKPGYVYEHEPQTGIIGELLRPNGVNHSIVNVSLATALRGCEKNEASYNVFQLDAFVNTTAISDIKQFPKVTQAIDAIDVSERTLLSLTQTIQTILENMLQMSSFNLTTYRSTIGAPTPEKDLATFIDQMQRVALQIQDVATSSRMTTLGSRSKRLQASILQPLEQLQNEILYHLTALELQRDPWAKQVNQTLNHLRNIQEYLEKTAGEICQNQTRIYTERLKTYLSNDKATMSSQLGETTARCRPFFDIFDANRIFLCRNMIDFVNALWFFTFLTLLLWSIAAPVGLNLITLQRKLNSLRQLKLRAAERATERGDSFSRGRRRDRARSSSRERDRSTSSTGRSRPTLQRSATEETLDIENLDDIPSQRAQMGRERERERERERSRERERERERERDRSRERERERERKSRSREVSQDKSGGRRIGQLQRQNTEDFDLEDDNRYGTSRSTSQAVQAARRTPPRSAPPPPPPPSNRFKTSGTRTVRWHAGDEDMVFEECDSPNPMYMSHDLND
ncbi:prominin isoform 2-T2 [Cochliomyia hominivorax]